VKDELIQTIAKFKKLDDKRTNEGLSDDEREEWFALKDVIEQEVFPDSAPPPSSRRDSLRVPTSMDVTFEDAQGFERAYLRNISEGGVYLETKSPLPMGTRFDLASTIADSGEAVKLRVEVVWVNSNPSPSSGLKPGVGVAWLDLPADEKALIKSIVHRALDDASSS
jgi:uncharacterized protein (TIGR02266 family)